MHSNDQSQQQQQQQQLPLNESNSFLYDKTLQSRITAATTVTTNSITTAAAASPITTTAAGIKPAAPIADVAASHTGSIENTSIPMQFKCKDNNMAKFAQPTVQQPQPQLQPPPQSRQQPQQQIQTQSHLESQIQQSQFGYQNYLYNDQYMSR